MNYCFTAPSGQRYANSLVPPLKGQEYGFDAFLLIVSKLQLIAESSSGRIFAQLVGQSRALEDAGPSIRTKETSQEGL